MVEKKRQRKKLGLSEVLVRVQLEREQIGLQQEALDLNRAKLELAQQKRREQMQRTMKKSLSKNNPFTV